MDNTGLRIFNGGDTIYLRAQLWLGAVNNSNPGGGALFYKYYQDYTLFYQCYSWYS